MDEATQNLGNLSAAMVLWIAGAVAAIFIFIVLFDAWRQHRKSRRMKTRRRSTATVKPKADMPLVL